MTPDNQRVIVHVDMDAFFAAVEQLDFPEYRGRPVVVGADPREGSGRGVVSTASYEARAYGIHSAMPISRAYRLCPTAVFARPRGERYCEVSRTVMSVLAGFSPLVEQLSIDEAFLDCTGARRLLGEPREIGESIKRAIRDATGLTSSVGIASCKSVAKIASDINKPDALTICPFGREREFIAPLPVSRLWGAGSKTVDYLKSFGFATIGDIASASMEEMETLLGKWGEHLWLLARGIDPREVECHGQRKSVSEEYTFDSDTSSDPLIEHTLLELADQLARRAREYGVRGRTITLKIRLHGFETHTRSLTLERPARDTFTIRDTALGLYRNFYRREKPVRLIGIRLSNLEHEAGSSSGQLDLFSPHDPGRAERERKEKIDEILDDLRQGFGVHVRRASLLD